MYITINLDWNLASSFKGLFRNMFLTRFFSKESLLRRSISKNPERSLAWPQDTPLRKTGSNPFTGADERQKGCSLPNLRLLTTVWASDTQELLRVAAPRKHVQLQDVVFGQFFWMHYYSKYFSKLQLHKYFLFPCDLIGAHCFVVLFWHLCDGI